MSEKVLDTLAKRFVMKSRYEMYKTQSHFQIKITSIRIVKVQYYSDTL